MTTTLEEAKMPGVETEAEVDQLREVLEHYWEHEWTDGLPVVPVTEGYLATFLATVDRDPEEVLFTITHLNRHLTVRLAAINAAMAGCRPEYFPVVVAAWEAIAKEPHPARGIWQSTSGTAPFLVVNGPIRNEIELILAEWDRFARCNAPVESQLTDLVLRDHAKQMLLTIAADIEWT